MMNRTEVQQLQNVLLVKHAVDKVRETTHEFVDNFDDSDLECSLGYLDDVDEAVELYLEARKLAKEIRT